MGVARREPVGQLNDINTVKPKSSTGRRPATHSTVRPRRETTAPQTEARLLESELGQTQVLSEQVTLLVREAEADEPGGLIELVEALAIIIADVCTEALPSGAATSSHLIQH